MGCCAAPCALRCPGAPLHPRCCPSKGDERPIDLRIDRPYRNLSEVHYAGREGLNATFAPGTYWEVGPFVEGVDPEIVVVKNKPRNFEAGPAFTQGTNYSAQPEDKAAKGKPCWFVYTETVWTPYTHNGKPSRQGGGQPPHVLSPLTPRMAAVSGLGCCDCVGYVPPCSGRILSCNAGVLQSQRAEIEALQGDLQRALARADTAETRLAHDTRKLAAARKALG